MRHPEQRRFSAGGMDFCAGFSARSPRSTRDPSLRLKNGYAQDERRSRTTLRAQWANIHVSHHIGQRPKQTGKNCMARYSELAAPRLISMRVCKCLRSLAQKTFHGTTEVATKPGAPRIRLPTVKSWTEVLRCSCVCGVMAVRRKPPTGLAPEPGPGDRCVDSGDRRRGQGRRNCGAPGGTYLPN